METDEREAYNKAIKKAGVSKAFDRILNICVIVVFFAISAFVVYQQADYQARVGEITKARNQQLDAIQYSQEVVNREADNLREFIACLKKLPVQPSDEQIAACQVK